MYLKEVRCDYVNWIRPAVVTTTSINPLISQKRPIFYHLNDSERLQKESSASYVFFENKPSLIGVERSVPHTD
jgi:hypothetical protein